MSGTVDLKEFEEFGYLQEANRQYFNLIGLELKIEEDNRGKRLVVVDQRDDSLGVVHPGRYDKKKGERVFDEFRRRSLARRSLFDGTTSQPIDRIISPGKVKKLRKQIDDSGYTGRLKPQ